jgi:hypothetical protein
MDELELQSIVQAEVEDAVSFIDSDVGPSRAQSVDYYFGRPFGDEEDGRSKVVSRDVHDTIQAVEPSLMRIFFSPENVVEFSPNGPEDVKNAEQATDYVNYIFTRDNDGFTILQAVFRNALREKCGIAKFWWDEAVEVRTATYTGLDEMSLQMLLEDLQAAEEADVVSSSEDENGLTVEIKLKKRTDRVRIMAIPPEEFLITRRAASMEDASMVAHRTMKTVSELVAMGYERELVESMSQDSDDLEFSDERDSRNPWRLGNINQGDKSQRLVLYVEAYMLVDYDDDGIAELRKVCCLGPDYKVAHNEPATYRPFADFHCDPEPHTFFGQDLADKTKDIQRSKSMVWRASLDSLAQSIYPRTVVIDNDGRMEDAMNPEVGAILRAKTPTGYVPLVTPFVGEQAFPMLTYMDSVREQRTGMSKVSMGLDAEALQNTTATAAEGQFTRSQDRIDLIARTLANGLRKLYRGILRLTVENQRQQRVVELRGQWVPVDPRLWRLDMDVVCNVGLGGGSDAAKTQILTGIAQKQEQIIATGGPSNPLAGLEELRNTYTKILELGGFKNTTAFFKELPKGPDGKVALPQQPPPPDPKLVEVQEKAKLAQMEAQAGAQLDQAKAGEDYRLKELQIQAEERVSMRRVEGELALKERQVAAELNLKERQLVAELELKREQGLMSAQVAHETGMAKVYTSAATSQVEPGGEPG